MISFFKNVLVFPRPPVSLADRSLASRDNVPLAFGNRVACDCRCPNLPPHESSWVPRPESCFWPQRSPDHERVPLIPVPFSRSSRELLASMTREMGRSVFVRRMRYHKRTSALCYPPTTAETCNFVLWKMPTGPYTFTKVV
jgi:hypothetical protein